MVVAVKIKDSRYILYHWAKMFNCCHTGFWEYLSLSLTNELLCLSCCGFFEIWLIGKLTGLAS